VSWIKLAHYKQERRSFVVITLTFFDRWAPSRSTVPDSVEDPAFCSHRGCFYGKHPSSPPWKWAQPDGRARVFSVQRGCDL
jgi:hypothetical protein